MQINLGCGNDIKIGYTNHDIIKHRKEIDIAFDLNEKDWKELAFYKNSVSEIRAYDVLEHLDSPISFMDNCWLSLKKGGVLDLKVCGWKNPNFYVDITHKKAYDINSFDYFDSSTNLGREYSYYTQHKWKILKKNLDRHNNIIISLTPVK